MTTLSLKISAGLLTGQRIPDIGDTLSEGVLQIFLASQTTHQDAINLVNVQNWQDAIKTYQTSMSSVAGQIETLKKALLSDDDKAFTPIANKGLVFVTDKHRTPLETALREAGDTGSQDKADKRASVASLADAFVKHLRSDDRVKAVQDNPWKVKVDIQGVLIPSVMHLASAARAV